MQFKWEYYICYIAKIIGGKFMKVIEGFHIKKIQRGTKKGQDYINHNKRYVWKIPERLEGQIEKGDIVWVHAKKDNKILKLEF